ncbi:hypothetical protein IEQ34_020750 [Dendrobium chrysotoxum]|uniref:Uncharacterized protein n=1 Tax=Dendrobium chrysotoxum TaxID=161865 RepID=A0AAV7G2Y7_DENCH|nr:hypothetical protein IEQ34_020750 [Dendrobium chrysotoxum]
MGSPERYNHISWVDLIKKQEIEKKRKKNTQEFVRINKRLVNILNGLELHICVLNPMEQKEIVQFIYALQNIGRKNEFGVNYRKKNGIPPGILCNGIVYPIPNLFKIMIK